MNIEIILLLIIFFIMFVTLILGGIWAVGDFSTKIDSILSNCLAFCLVLMGISVLITLFFVLIKIIKIL